MSRVDLAKLRKRGGMSQRELAELLQVRPSFLSAIENGRSRIPEEKYDRILEIFELDSLDDYMTDDQPDYVMPPHTHNSDPSESLSDLLNHFHDLAHRRSAGNGSVSNDMSERIDFLTKRNDRLSERVDDLRDEVDSLRVENLRLKELLIKNGIPYS